MMQTTENIEELISRIVPYVIVNRRKKAFVDWTETQIADSLRGAILDCSLLWASNERGDIIGVIHGEIDEKRKLFHVINCLTSSHNVLRLFVGAFDEMYPTLSLAGYRHGNYKLYNTKKFKQKILQKN